ncbi:MAG: hypothetical protein ACLQGU_08255 [bacterium]
MRGKKLTYGITFFTTPEMYQAIKNDSDEFGISTSDLMRRLIEDYLNGTHSYSRTNVTEREVQGISIKEAEHNEQP